MKPFPVADYLSALAQADWYEENNQEKIAEGIRLRTRPPIEAWSMCDINFISIANTPHCHVSTSLSLGFLALILDIEVFPDL